MENTQYYQLSLWNQDDRILMDTFNGNNQKLDAALQAEKSARETLAETVAKCGNCQIYSESYTGNGSTSRTFTFPQKPMLVILIGTGYTMVAVRGSSSCTSHGASGPGENGTLTWGATSVKFSMASHQYACNTSGSKYGLFALLDASV